MTLHKHLRLLSLGLVLALGVACGGGGGGGGGGDTSGGGGSVPGPIASSLTAGATSIPVGDSTTLTPVFTNGTGVITPGNIAATSGTAITVSPTTTTTYTLTVTNSVGVSATTTATVTVVAAPVATSLTAGAAVITAGTLTTLTPVFTNGTGVITPGNIAATSGTAITVSPTTTTTYTLTVTNTLGSSTTTTATVTVVAAPVATSLTAGASAIAVGTSTTLTPVFTNGTGVITPGNIAATSGTAITVSPTTTTTYTLTVTNTLGATATKSVTVTSITQGPLSEVNLTENVYYAKAVLYKPDTVMLIGGTNRNNEDLSMVQSYNVTTNTWSVFPSLNTAHTQHQVVQLATGNILVFGGYSNTASTPISEIFVPTGSSGSWIQVGSTGSERYEGESVLLSNGKVLTTGGFASSNTILSSCELFNPSTNGWSTTASMSVARLNHTLIGIDSTRVMAIGGYNTTSLATTAIYSSTTSSWSAGPTMAQRRYRHSATRLPDGKILVVGGQEGNSGFLNSCEIYNPVSGVWTTTGSLASPRSLHTATLLPNGKVLVLGGQGAEGILRKVEIYDPTSGTWSSLPSLSSPRSRHTATLVSGDRLIVSGGQSSDDISGTSEIYFYQDPIKLGASSFWMTVGSSVTLTPTFTSGTASIDNGVGTVTSGQSITVSPSSTTTYTLSVVASGQTSTRSVTINVLAAPVATSLTASSPSVLPGSTTSLIPVFSGGIGIITPGDTAVSSGQSYNVSPSSKTEYTLSVTNAVGSTALVKSTIDLFSLNSFIASSTSITKGDSVALTANFTGGTLIVNPGNNNLASGVPLGVTPTATTTYTATLTNASGSSASKSLTVTVFDSANTWSSTGSANVGVQRNTPTLTLLQNANVLLVGDSGSKLAAQIYQPTLGTWKSTAGPTTQSRVDHTATLLSTGNVLVVGGQSGPSSEIYDPASDTWTSTGNLLTARYLHSSALLANGRVLASGGVGASQTLSSAEIYNPSSGLWTSTGSMQVTRSRHTTTLLANGKVLAVGGDNSSAGGNSYYQSSELYDPETGLWSTLVPTVAARTRHSATLLKSGKVLIVGGSFAGGVLKSSELYDPSSNTWTLAATPSTARQDHTATLLPSGLVLVSGGRNETGTALSSSEIYNPDTNVWSTVGSLMAARIAHAATLLPNGKVLIALGYSGNTYLNSAELFDPQDPIKLGASSFWMTVGSSVTLTPTFTSGTASIDNGVGTVTSGQSITVSPSSITTYTLSVVASGQTNTRSVTINVLAAPVATSLTANASAITAGNSTKLTPVFSGGTGIITPGNIIATSGVAVDITPSVTTTYTLTVTNDLFGSTSVKTALITVVPPPLIDSFNATSLRIPTGAAVTLKALFRNGTGIVTPGNLSVTSGVAVSISPTETTTYTLTVSNSLGSNAVKSVKVLVENTSLGQWASTSNMVEPRYVTSMTLLASTKVLAAGGVGSSNLSSAELYDPATGTWSSTGSMAAARYAHTAILLPNGKVLVAGGYNNSSGVLSSAELYDPATGTWSPTGSMATVRYYHTATLLRNGKVLVAGGFGSTGSSLMTAELYDPATGTWSTTGSLATGRARHTATLLLNGRILVTGGYGSIWLASVELYDPDLGTWTTGAPMKQARSAHSAILLKNSKVLVAIGGTSSSTWTATCEIYDPTLNTWTDAGSVSQERYYGSLALLPNGNPILIGGYANNAGPVWGSANAGPVWGSAAVDIYDAALGTWSTASSMNTARAWTNAVLLSNNKVFIAGGYGKGNVVNSAELFDPQDPIKLGASSFWMTVGSSVTLTPTFTSGTASIDNGVGTVTSGQSITVSPSSTTTYTLSVVASGQTSTRSVTINVLAAPVATSLTAAASAIAVGASTTLTPVFSNGTGVITPGNLPATSGTAISVSPTTTTTYTLTVSNTGGTIVSITCVITVVPAPVATSLTPQDFSIILGNSTTLTPVFTGGTAKIGTTSGGSQITASAISANPITITPNQTTSYFLTVTNALGAIASTSTTVTVVGAPGPSITNFVASSNSINAGQSTSLTAIFSNGTGVVTGGSSPVSISSGIPIFVAPLSTTTYLLTVSNTTGTSVTKSLTITVTSSSRSLSYIDPTSGTYRLVKNVALSTSNHLVLDLVSTDSQLVSGIGLNIESDNTKVIWVKAASSDATLIQNGNIFNLGSSPQVLYGKVISGTTSSTLSAVIALKGPTGVAINGSGSVLARMALDPLSTGASGVVTLTVNKAQANIQGVSSPSTITVNVGTLTLN